MFSRQILNHINETNIPFKHPYRKTTILLSNKSVIWEEIKKSFYLVWLNSADQIKAAPMIYLGLNWM